MSKSTAVTLSLRRCLQRSRVGGLPIGVERHCESPSSSGAGEAGREEEGEEGDEEDEEEGVEWSGVEGRR